MAEDFKGGKSEITETIVVAADHGRLDLVTALLERGEDPNTVNEIGTSALHNAAKEITGISPAFYSSTMQFLGSKTATTKPHSKLPYVLVTNRLPACSFTVTP